MSNNLAIAFRKAQGEFRPSLQSRFARESKYAKDLNHYSLVVGLVAMALPIILYCGGEIGSSDYDSISHYYYSRHLGGVFVISVALIAATMFAFKGETRFERRFARAGSFALILTAFFPTSGPGSETFPREGRAFVEIRLDANVLTTAESGTTATAIYREGCADGDLFEETKCVFVDPFEATGAGDSALRGLERHFTFSEDAPWLEYVHFFSAAVVFVLLFIFCVFIFARVDPWHLKSGKILENGLIDGEVGDAKKLRNRIYYACGGFILVSLAALGWNAAFNDDKTVWNEYNLTFWFEALGLFAFGVAWSVRGRILPTLFNDAAERVRLKNLINDAKRRSDQGPSTA